MSRMRWGDSADVDEDDSHLPPVPAPSGLPAGLPDDGTLPERQVFGPDAKGMKTIIDWRLNDEGLKVKVTTKMRVRTVTKKVTKDAIARRNWKKFGDAKDQKETDRVTMASTEEIYLEKVCQVSKKTEEKKDDGGLGALAGKNASLLVCRICGKKGDHWTSKCPYKDLAATKGLTFGEKPPDEDGPGGGSKGGYVPPSMRAGAKGEVMGGESMRRGRDDNSVRVTNLSEDTREQDLQELFRPFGARSAASCASLLAAELCRGPACGWRCPHGAGQCTCRPGHCCRLLCSRPRGCCRLWHAFCPWASPGPQAALSAGPITRIYVAFDRETGESRGFAFINFVNREDAQRAIDKLDGYGYDNLILRVEWAAPRAEKT